jgi:threonine dehydrogenase-like Zn-dependent dehydrogenase
MFAITFQDIESVAFERIADPQIEAPGDAIVAVHLAGICGSDLHVFHGREKGLDLGTALGHEFVGEIVAVGPDVARLQTGNLVASPFTTSCGHCPSCRRGLTARCQESQLFGWREHGSGLHGAQAELVRVPLADSTLVEIPEGVTPEGALLAGDVLSTGYFCAAQGAVAPGATVAVIGCGPVGLMAVLAARHLGAERVFALDRQPERLRLAAGFGGEPLNLQPEEAASWLEQETQGLGVDIVLEAVGSPSASRMAMQLVRPGGTISAVGVHTEPAFAFSPVEAYDKNLTYRIGRCPARHYMNVVLPLLVGSELDPTVIISHRLALSEGAHGYQIFANRLDGCTKAVLIP